MTVRIRNNSHGIYELIMDDPENENRLGEELCDSIMTALTALATEADLRVLLLMGRKEVFSGGATLEALHKISSGVLDVKDLRLPAQLLGFPMPVIAAMEGHAVGGGLMMALCCDITVAAEERRYGANFTSLGFTPGMGSTGLLPALAGVSFASEMLMSARFYKGRELRGRGLFTHIVPAAEVEAVAWDIARSIADKPRHVLQMLKETLTKPRRECLEQAMPQEHRMHRACFQQAETESMIDNNYIHPKRNSHGS